ncbi:MAG: ABATE domain-containing protein [Anaerolineae bacterium]|nr:ABATE domain-containing protein [Anaerolineae bacterium]
MDDHHTEFDINSGALCLSFANAFNISASDTHEEMIKEYADLIKWAQTLEVIDDTTAQSLLHRANQHPDEAATILQSAWSLRRALFGIFAAIAHHKSPDPTDLDVLNTRLPETLAHQLN